MTSSRALMVVCWAVLGAAVVVITVDVLALLARAMDIAWLRDVAVNTGPLAVAGGAAAGGAAAGAGAGGDHARSSDPFVPFSTKIYDPSTGTMRDPSLYDRILWEAGRILGGFPTDEERHNQIMGDENLRTQYRNEINSRTDSVPDGPSAEPTTPGTSPAEPANQAGGADPPSSTGDAPQDPEPGDGPGVVGGGGGTIHQKAGTG